MCGARGRAVNTVVRTRRVAPERHSRAQRARAFCALLETHNLCLLVKVELLQLAMRIAPKHLVLHVLVGGSRHLLGAQGALRPVSRR